MNDERCPCGGIILADTEDWKTPLCYSCYTDLHEGYSKLQSECESLRNKLAEGVHTCSDECTRPMCVMRRECERKDKVIAELLRGPVEVFGLSIEEVQELISFKKIWTNLEAKNYSDLYLKLSDHIKTKDAQLAKYKAALEFAERRIDQIHSWSGAKDEATAIRKIEELATKYLKHERAALAEGDGSGEERT